MFSNSNRWSEPGGDADTAGLLNRYAQTLAAAGHVQALQGLCAALAVAPQPLWEACAAELARRGEYRPAMVVLDRALGRYKGAPALRWQVGEVLRQASEFELAEQALRPLLGGPEDRRAALSLAQALRGQGRLSAATRLIAERLEHDPADLDLTLDRLRFISQSQRESLADELCARELHRFPEEPRMRFFAGRLATVLGRFEEARSHYLATLKGGVDLNEVFVLQALSRTLRYRDTSHPDFELYRSHLEDLQLAPTARGSVLFGFGKACDDIGDWARATAALREANALVRAGMAWSRAEWLRYVEEQLAAPLPPVAGADQGIVPVFVVGLPRSGTTLAADRLARHPQVRGRGELGLLPYLEKWRGRGPAANDRGFLQHLSRFAAAQLRQDDAPARWYIDKNPLNFRYLGLIAAVLPQARIIWCRRDPRDTALSIWSQFFARGDDNGYAYDFADIAAFTQGCERLMRHWQQVLSLPVYELQYERLIAQPDDTLRGLAEFLGLPQFDLLGAAPGKSAITTSSAWQARQPIYSHANGRWHAYAPHIPELLELF